MSSKPPDNGPENPYESPTSGAGGRGDDAAVDLFTASSRFEVGEKERHAICVTWSIWSGEEVYEIDDVEVARLRSFEVSGAREFDVGEAEKHHVEIRFRSLPFNVVEVYVDGKRHIRNLFPRLSLMIWTLAAVVCVPIGLLIVWYSGGS